MNLNGASKRVDELAKAAAGQDNRLLEWLRELHRNTHKVYGEGGAEYTTPPDDELIEWESNFDRLIDKIYGPQPTTEKQ